MGKIVLQKSIHKGVTELDVSNLASGYYTVSIQSDNKSVYTSKMIKQ